jgi:Holliday junction resolvasome RuvABC ATP-dependent DNA helicase subunit
MTNKLQIVLGEIKLESKLRKQIATTWGDNWKVTHIITGPAASGKTTLARLIAESLQSVCFFKTAVLTDIEYNKQRCDAVIVCITETNQP